MGLYYIRDTRQIVGNCVMWWAKDAKGYTCDLDRAHLYTEEEVESQDWRDTDIPMPEEEINALAYRHVDIQRIRAVRKEKRKEVISPEDKVIR